MKRICLISMMFLAAAGFAVAQAGAPTSDVLGAHLNYGRGCAACHAPHSGAFGNGVTPTKDAANSGSVALWGEDVSLAGTTINFGQMDNGTLYPAVLPGSVTAALTGDPTVTGILMCLSCHDGNNASAAMMQGTIYEKITGTNYGSNWKSIPTLLGKDGTTTSNYLNDHPVGQAAIMKCGGSYNWDCSASGSTISMTGTNSAAFVKNYGFFVSPASYTATVGGTTVPIVVCTTCHNQHLMNVVQVTAKNSGMTPTGPYTTMFFLRGPYNSNTTTAGSNQNAQFCRQCHGGEGNESNGALNIPTTF
jgi:cytochrome c553